MQKSVQFALLAGASVIVTSESEAAVSYNTVGAEYKQNFDTLPNAPANASLGTTPAGWIDDSATPPAGNFSIPGWYLYHPLVLAEGGANGHARMRAGTGSATTGAFWSFGPSGNADRALGTLNADTTATPSDAVPPPATLEDQQMFMAVRLTNDTGTTLNSFTLQYDAEQWRKSGNGAETWDFEYSLDPSATVSSPHSLFTPVDAGDFTSPNNTATAAALDGNAAGNRVVVAPFTVNDINWAPGTDLWLRWADTNMPGADSALRADQGMALDNLIFTAAVPEPTGLALLALGAAGLLGRRRNA